MKFSKEDLNKSKNKLSNKMAKVQFEGAHISTYLQFFGGERRPIGESPKKFGPLGPSKKCHKINILSVSSLFLAFLECLDTRKNYSQLPSHPHCHHKKNQKLWLINVILKNIFVRGSNLTPMLKEC